MVRRSRRSVMLAAGVTLGWHCWQRRLSRQRKRSGLTPPQQRFLQLATVLEAQQVAMYHRLSRQASRRGSSHLETGLWRAMEVEAEHLHSLRTAGRGMGLCLWAWTLFGNGLGRVSGQVLRRLRPSLQLKTIRAIEGVAANDYVQARIGLTNQALWQIYLRHQVDEEYHLAWAGLMLARDRQKYPGGAEEP